MPTISRSLLNPSCTPLTALATRARVRPCSARCWRVSSARLNTTAPLSTAQVMPGGRGLASDDFPFSTSTVFPCTLTETPAGRTIGCFPILDMTPSPDVAHDFAAHAGIACLARAQQPLRRRQDAQAQPAHHRGDLVEARVDTPPRTAHHLDPREQRVALPVVAQRDPDTLERPLLDGGDRGDVPLVLEDAGDRQLHVRVRNLDAGVPRPHGIPDARQHVGDRIGHDLLVSLSVYQLDFVTPGTIPCSDRFRKQIRHI